jgi:hypothetical protein
MQKYKSLARRAFSRYTAIDRRQLLSLGLILGTAAILNCAGSSRASALPQAGARKVYAHWHWFPTSFDNAPPETDIYANYLSPEGAQGKFRAEGGYIRERPLPRPPRPEPNWAVLDMGEEIKAAHAIGLDGFQFNIGSVEPDSVYMVSLRRMLEAANAGPASFKIVLSLDALILKNTSADLIVEAILGSAKNSAVARHSDGRLILGAFAPEQWEVDRWKAVLQKLSDGGEKVYFFPTFLDVGRTVEFIDLIDGASMWGVDRLSEIRRLKRTARRVKRAGKAWASVVWPQDFRPKDRWFAESRNSELFRASWQAAMETGADAVNICTWNDYSEGSEIRPSTSIQYAFYDLASFYIAWFKTGERPRVTEDTLYYFHRIESTEAAGTGTAQPFRFSSGYVARFLNPVCNDIELLAFLKAPAEIEIVTAKGTRSLKAKSGITSFRTALVPGKVSFRIKRENHTVLSCASAFEIREESSYQNLLYHAGSSSRPPV